MMSSSVPGSALNCRTASRRLPLPRPPSVKVVGVSVVGTQRYSKSSMDGRNEAHLVRRRQVMDVTPKKGEAYRRHESAAASGLTGAVGAHFPRRTAVDHWSFSRRTC